MPSKNDFKFRGNLALRVYDQKHFDSVIPTILENKSSFRIVHRPYSTELFFDKPDPIYMFGHHLMYGGFCKVNQMQTDSSFNVNAVKCIAEMNANIIQNISQLIRDGKLNPIKPINDWPVSFLFRDNWAAIKVGDPLWYIDFDNFYPSIAVKLGYLHKEMMEKYIDEEFKRSRNIAISKLMSIVKVDYFINGKLDHSIQTDRSMVENAYLNVIQYARNFVNYLCIKYRWGAVGRDIDNIIFPYAFRTIIPGKYIHEHGFDYKRFLAYKISDNEFKISFNGNIKRYNRFID